MLFFVTGATGFVGSAIVDRLRSEGRRVVALVRSEKDVPSLEEKGVECKLGDLSSPRALAEAIGGASRIIHAAGIADERAPLEVHGWVNVAGTDNLLKAAHYQGVRRFVFISSADATLDGTPRRGHNENRGLSTRPIGKLGRTKKEAEELVATRFAREIETVILRPGIVWGAGDRLFLPRIARAAIEGRLRSIGDGKNFIATTHVENLAEAAVKGALREEAAFGIYYVPDPEMLTQRRFLTLLTSALVLRPPKSGWGLGMHRMARRFGRELGGHGFIDAMRLGLSTSFDGSSARSRLHYVGAVFADEAAREIERWVNEIGGIDALLALEAQVPGLELIEEQKKLALSEEFR
ncbi:MAG: NAD-dependent epimerase/dehydratase family protein [Sandaracinaceae bacterium]|nr:NAD-dependent epimerase/dehydratase family protein [Sandaracinaceae bacterium]